MATCCQRWPVGCHLLPPSLRGCSRYGPLSQNTGSLSLVQQCHHIWLTDNTLGDGNGWLLSFRVIISASCAFHHPACPLYLSNIMFAFSFRTAIWVNHSLIFPLKILMSLLTFAQLFTDSKLYKIWGINLRDQPDGIVLLLLFYDFLWRIEDIVTADFKVKQIQMLSACEEGIFVHRTLQIILFIRQITYQ